MLRILLLAVSLMACGAPSVEETEPTARLRGKYDFDFYRGESVGECDFLGSTILATLEFDDEGTLQSPLKGIVDCHTEYPGGLASFKCEGLGNTLRGTVTGIGAEGETVTAAWGSGLITGNVGGCKRVEFGFGLTRWAMQ